MKTRSSITAVYLMIIISVMLISINLSASEKTKSVKVTKGGKLDASIPYGNFTIRTWEKDEMFIKYDSEVEIDITQRGNTVIIETDDYSDEMDFEITTPSQFNFDLNTAGGNIEFLNNITGTLSGNTAGGNITVRDVTGNADLNTAGGNITIGSVSGNTDISTGGGEVRINHVGGMCEVSTGGGNITIGKVNKSLEVSTGGGNITISDVGGMTEVSTGGGNVLLGKVSGSLSASTGGGNIEAKAADGEVEANTGGGNIILKNISGSARVHSGGGNLDVQFNSMGLKESELLTGMGDIKVAIPGDARVTVTVRISDLGWIQDEDDLKDNIKSDFKASEFNINRERGEVRAEYILNGGGPEIKIETGMGKVELKKIK